MKSVAAPSAYTGPGPQTLTYGDSTMGFYGEVDSTDFISGSALASAIGLTAGTLINDTTPWLKFALDGKTLFIPKMNIRHTATWQDIYQAGAVYGDGTVGTFPAGTERLQDAAVTVGASIFKVSLPQGTIGDNAGNFTGYDIDISQGSEFSRLFYPLSTTSVASHTSPRWNLYTDTQLDMVSNYSWCRDAHSYTSASRVLRGYFDVSYLNRTGFTGASSLRAWRPCLELVQ